MNQHTERELSLDVFIPVSLEEVEEVRMRYNLIEE